MAPRLLPHTGGGGPRAGGVLPPSFGRRPAGETDLRRLRPVPAQGARGGGLVRSVPAGERGGGSRSSDPAGGIPDRGSPSPHDPPRDGAAGEPAAPAPEPGTRLLRRARS